MSVESQFDPVRFYTSLDPYNWQVDNRPLQDINTNLMTAAQAINAVFDSAKSAAMAAGFVARGFATDNMYVGALTFTSGSYDLIIAHGFLIQSLQASPVAPVDLKFYPHLGLQQTSKTFTGGVDIYPPTISSKKNLFTIQARKVAANSSISFYDSANHFEPGAFNVGTVQYTIKSFLNVSDTDPDTFPLPDSGWVSLLHIKLSTSDTELAEGNVFYDNFILDGTLANSSKYEVHTVQIPDPSVTYISTTTRIVDIEVEAQNALIFLNGAYQNPTKYTVVNSAEIIWNGVLPSGSTLDFVTIKGGLQSTGGSGGGVYSYNVETFISDITYDYTAVDGVVTVYPFYYTGVGVGSSITVVSSTGSLAAGTYVVTAATSTDISFSAAIADETATVNMYPTGQVQGQQIFGPVSVADVQYAFPFINGSFQPDCSPNIPYQLIITPEPIPTGGLLDLVTTAGGTVANGIPAPGLIGQVLQVTNAGLAWRFPDRIASVTSITTIGLTTTITTSVDFDESTEVYNGMSIRIDGILNGLDFTSNTVENVIIELGALSLPLYRPIGGTIRVNDIYDGMVVKYHQDTNSLILQNPMSEGRIFASSYGSISTDTITVVPKQPLFSVYSGLQITFEVPGTSSTSSVSSTVAMTMTVASTPVAYVIARNGGSDLRPGDMVAGQTVTLQYDGSLGLFILLNPAVQSTSSAPEIPNRRRQTVISGPRTKRTQTLYRATSGGFSGGSREFYYAKPYIIRPSNGSGVEALTSTSNFKLFTSSVDLYSNTLASDFNYGPTFASFSAGNDAGGAVEYVEQLPESSEFSISSLAATHFGGVPGFSSISALSANSVNSTLTVTVPSAHGYQAGHWVRIKGSKNKNTNGIHLVVAVSPSTITLRRRGSNSDPISVAAETIEGVLFVYADRDVTGVITYGVTPYRPACITPSISDPASAASAGIEQAMKRANRHIFNTDTMRMTLGNGSGYSEVRRVFIGEIYLPASGSQITDENCVTYAYNGEATIEIPGVSLDTNGGHYYIPHGLGTTSYSYTMSLNYDGSTGRITSGDVAEYALFDTPLVSSFQILGAETVLSSAQIDPGFTLILSDFSHSVIHRYANANRNHLDINGDSVEVTVSSPKTMYTLRLIRNY